MMDEGSVGRDGWTKVKLLALEVVWLQALKSVTQSVTAGGTIFMVLKEWASGSWCRELVHSVHAARGGGARGGAKVGSIYCE
jgi:hypothetical protein